MRAVWDGASGITAHWQVAARATGAVRYDVIVETEARQQRGATQTADASATVDGLPDGVYRVRVVATDSADAASDGGVV